MIEFLALSCLKGEVDGLSSRNNQQVKFRSASKTPINKGEDFLIPIPYPTYAFTLVVVSGPGILTYNPCSGTTHSLRWSNRHQIPAGPRLDFFAGKNSLEGAESVPSESPERESQELYWFLSWS